MKNYKTFNIICAIAAGFFVLALAYLWRNMFVRGNAGEHASGIPAVSYEDIQQNAAKIQEQPNHIAPVEEEAPSSANESTSVEEKTLPKEMNLAVPFTSQAPEADWSQPWQDACEEAAVLMLDAYYKEYKLDTTFVKDELVKMIDWEENVQGWGRSIEIEKVQKLYAWYAGDNALPMQIVEDPTVDELKEFLAAGHPVLVVADGKVLPNPHFRGGGPEYHALIIRGYTEEAFITNDPGTKFGEQFLYTYSDLMNAIHDWNAGDVQNGRVVVMVAR